MKYTILLIEKSEGGIHVSVPALPDCTVEADTRDDAIRLAREAITEQSVLWVRGTHRAGGVIRSRPSC
jgi:hypothetical protein